MMADRPRPTGADQEPASDELKLRFETVGCFSSSAAATTTTTTTTTSFSLTDIRRLRDKLTAAQSSPDDDVVTDCASAGRDSSVEVFSSVDFDILRDVLDAFCQKQRQQKDIFRTATTEDNLQSSDDGDRKQPVYRASELEGGRSERLTASHRVDVTPGNINQPTKIDETDCKRKTFVEKYEIKTDICSQQMDTTIDRLPVVLNYSDPLNVAQNEGRNTSSAAHTAVPFLVGLSLPCSDVDEDSASTDDIHSIAAESPTIRETNREVEFDRKLIGNNSTTLSDDVHATKSKRKDIRVNASADHCRMSLDSAPVKQVSVCAASVGLPSVVPVPAVPSSSSASHSAAATNRAPFLLTPRGAAAAAASPMSSNVAPADPAASSQDTDGDRRVRSLAACAAAEHVTVTREMWSRVTAQNFRLKRTLEKIISDKFGSTNSFLTAQEYEDVIQQLRDDNRVLSTRNDALRDLLRARNDGDVDALSLKCVQLSDKVVTLQKSSAIRETLLNALIQKQQQQQQQQQTTTRQQRYDSLPPSGKPVAADQPPAPDRLSQQLAAKLVALKQKYELSTERSQNEIASLRLQLQRLRMQQQAASDLSLPHPVTEVGHAGDDTSTRVIRDEDTTMTSLPSVDILRPPTSTCRRDVIPPVTSSDSDAAAAAAATTSVSIGDVLVCPRCEREFASSNDAAFMAHCVKCIDD